MTLEHAGRILNMTLDDLYGGRLKTKSALVAAVASVREAIADLEANQVDLEDLANAFRLLGLLYLEQEDLDNALDCFADAMDRFESAGGDSQQYGEFLHDFAITLYEHNVPVSMPIDLAEKSRAILSRYGRGHVRRLDSLIADLRSTQTGDADARLGSRRRDLKKSRRGLDRAMAAQALVVALLDTDRYRDHLAEIHDALATAYENISTHGTTEQVCAVLRGLVDMYWMGLPIPSWADAATMAALTRTQREERFDLERDMLAARAALLHQSGRIGMAVDHALTAAARHDEHILATGSSHVRFLSTLVGQVGREIAVRIAVEAGDALLAAELIESARLQVVPVGGSGGDPEQRRSYVGQLRPVEVGGRSQIAARYRPGAVGSPLSLNAVIDRVGGVGAWWWGTWAVNGAVYWALRHDGRWSCGELAIEGTELFELLMRAGRESMHEPTATTAQRIAGEWCRNVAAEEILSVDLGEALIPPPIIAAMLRPSTRTPISLVLAGNLHTILPVALLGVRPGPASPSVRLIEAAVLRVAPPAVIINQMSVSSAVSAATHDIIVACVDPRGDLRHSTTPPDGARIVLGSGDDGRPVADLENLSASLRTGSPGDPGVFFYSGHAMSPGMDGDDEDALALADGQLLAAADLFAPSGNRFPFPARTILSACKSSGAGGSGAGEWLGLTAAILQRGGRQVVATNWNIWDTPFTLRFDLELARRLHTSDDVASALRDAQLAAYREWRASHHDFTDYDELGLPDAAMSLPLPLIWAAYCCVGVLR